MAKGDGGGKCRKFEKIRKRRRKCLKEYWGGDWRGNLDICGEWAKMNEWGWMGTEKT
jgi:hypothetical protein